MIRLLATLVIGIALGYGFRAYEEPKPVPEIEQFVNVIRASLLIIRPLTEDEPHCESGLWTKLISRNVTVAEFAFAQLEEFEDFDPSTVETYMSELRGGLSTILNHARDEIDEERTKVIEEQNFSELACANFVRESDLFTDEDKEALAELIQSSL